MQYNVIKKKNSTQNNFLKHVSLTLQKHTNVQRTI